MANKRGQLSSNVNTASKKNNTKNSVKNNKDVAPVRKIRPKVHPIFSPKRTLGQKSADKLAEFAGSWSFIIGFMVIMFIWIIINVVILTTRPFDPYPFILLNLCLSCLAAIQAPVILMAQNRQAERDRNFAKYDHSVNLKAEKEIQDMQKDLDEIKSLLKG
ncbi:MAG: DUF1003 domain-containing protein [Candidatus Woesearchaeota archaeon]